MRITSTLLVLLAACAAPEPTTAAVTGAAVQEIVVVSPSLLEPTAAALIGWDLDWHMTSSDVCPAWDWCVVQVPDVGPCGAVADAWACTDRFAKVVWVDAAVPPRLVASVVRHEIGHVLGMGHTNDGTVMDPAREELRPAALVVTPAPGLEELTASAVALLNTAPGLHVVVGEDGVPIGLTADTGKCGRALQDADGTNTRIWLQNNPTCLKRIVLAHEIGHVVSNWGRCNESGTDHATGTTEVMSELGGGLIGPESRALLCSCGACVGQN